MRLKGSGRGLIIRYYPGIRVEGLRKTTKNLSQDSRSPGRNLKPGSSEYEAGALINLPRLSMPYVAKLLQLEQISSLNVR
jgi:hypothetical protein